MNAREALNSAVTTLEKMGFVIIPRSKWEANDKEIAALRKALEQIEQQLDYGQISMALQTTRAALKEDSDVG